MTPPRHRSLAYVPALDGLRGITILCLLTFHAESVWLSGGYLSVSTFFTLSGFLITSLLLVEQDTTGHIDLREFWVRRLRRLMPAALLGVALAASFALLAASTTQIARLRWDGLSALFYFANFRFMTSGHSYWEMFSRPSPLQHYWSLSIEEQFYVVYPLLLLGVAALIGRGRGPLRTVLVVLAAASTALMLALSLAGVPTGRLYYGTDTRAAEFLVGAVLATGLVRGGEIRPWRGRGSNLVTLACVTFVIAALALVAEDSRFLYRGGFALYALAMAGVLNAALAPGVVQRVLSLRPLRWLGTVSYGTYVYHWPIYLYLDAQRTGLAGLPLLLLQIAVTLVVAAASKSWVEQPIREGKRLRGVRAALAFPAAATAVTALVLFAAAAKPDPWQHIVKPVSMPKLGPPAPLGPLRVLVFGDSLAWNIGRGFIARADRHPEQVTVWSVAQYGCGLVRDSRLPHSQHEAVSACANWPDFWEAKVDEFRPDLVVVVSGVWDLRTLMMDEWTQERSPGDPVFDAWLLEEYRRAVDIASARGAHVVWFNAPCVGPVPPDSPLRQDDALEPARIEHLNRVLLPALVASRPRQVEVFDLFAEVCPDGRYVKSLDGISTARADFLHLSPGMSLAIATRILARSAPSGAAAASAPPARRTAVKVP